MPKLADKLPYIDPTKPRLYARILEAAQAERERRLLGSGDREQEKAEEKRAWLLRCKELDAKTGLTEEADGSAKATRQLPDQ